VKAGLSCLAVNQLHAGLPNSPRKLLLLPHGCLPHRCITKIWVCCRYYQKLVYSFVKTCLLVFCASPKYSLSSPSLWKSLKRCRGKLRKLSCNRRLKSRASNNLLFRINYSFFLSSFWHLSYSFSPAWEGEIKFIQMLSYMTLCCCYQWNDILLQSCVPLKHTLVTTNI